MRKSRAGISRTMRSRATATRKTPSPGVRGKHAAMLQQAKRAMAGGVSDGNLAGLRGIAKQALTDRALDLRVDAGKVRRGRARHEGAGDEGLKRKKKDEGVSENAPT